MGGVFANGLEISGKAVSAKTIAAMPDVCFTPPENPATPPGVPVPYPSFGMASDTDKGTGTVKIGGETVNIKNKSYLTKTSGTEAGSAAKKGIITSKNTGKKYFNSWSNDVKFDGEPVIRFTDLATHNHASPGGQTPPWLETALANAPPNPDGTPCMVGAWEDIRDKCNAQKDTTDTGVKNNAYQAHHIVPDRCYRTGRTKLRGKFTAGGKQKKLDSRMTDCPSHKEGICICLPRLKHSAGRPPSGDDVTVHHHLDDALTALGEQVATSDSPRGVASAEEVRDQSLAALAELVDETVTEECFEIASQAVVEQVAPYEDKKLRAEKSLKKLSTTARGVLNKQ
ncbi:MAG: DUF4150 domain-containing protein [Paracoccaceae bacterium]